MFESFFSFTKTFQVPDPVDPDYSISPRMMFALRERLEEEGLGNSPQALNLDRAFIYNRDYILEELGPLFRQIDKSRSLRTENPRYWWWKLDDAKLVADMARRLGVLKDADE